MSNQDLELLKSEIEILKICQHPNIIRLYDVFDKPFADYCIAQINGVLEEQSVRMIEYDLNHEGEMIYFEGRLAPFIDQETGEMQVIWITRDISERKITEEALRQSEERYRIISNLISDNAFYGKLPNGMANLINLKVLLRWYCRLSAMFIMHQIKNTPKLQFHLQMG